MRNRRLVWTALPALVLSPFPRPLAAQAPAESGVIRATTHVVILNVVVQDKHGRPVDDLRRQDFVMRDNGQQQPIAFFALDDARRSAGASPPSSAALTLTNRPPLGAARVTALLFDQLNTRLADQQLAKTELMHYLRNMPATERIAVFALGDSLALLHDFSQDTAALAAAIGKHADRVSSEADASAGPPVSSESLTGDRTTTAQWDRFLRSEREPYVNYAETVRATRTAAALETIASHLEGIPGRKTLIWISAGFPIQLGLHSAAGRTPQSSAAAHSSTRAPQPARPAGAQTATARGARAASGSSSTANSGPAAKELPGTGLSFANDLRAPFAR